MYHIAVCDDEMCYITRINDIVKRFAGKSQLKIQQKDYTSALALVEEVERGIYYDIYILDIEMPELSGTEIVKIIKQNTADAVIIFVTAYLQYMLESFELEIFRYIPKETLEERLPLALQAAFTKLELQEGKFYLISNAKRTQKIFFKDIIYIYKDRKNSIFVLDSQEIKNREPLFEVFQKLNNAEFMQADRCLIVNLQHINKIDAVNGQLTMKNEIVLNISKSRVPEVKKILADFWGAEYDGGGIWHL